MGILDSLSKTFLPSGSEAARRRKDVFGTESKAVAGVVIVGAAAAVAAAPAAIAGGGLRTAAAKLAGLSFGSKVALGVAAPVALGAVVSDPTVATRTAGGLANVEKNLYQFGADPSLESAKNIFTENPVITGILGGAAVLGAGRLAAAPIASAIQSETVKDLTKEIKKQNEEIIDTIKESSSPVGIIPPESPKTQEAKSQISDVPLTPETQVLGKQVQSGTLSKKRKHSPRPTRAAPPVRVNIINQNHYIDV